MYRYALLVFLGACSFGFSSTLVKLTLADGYNIRDAAGAQVFFGTLALWLFFLLRKTIKRSSGQRSTVREPKWKVILAGFSTGLVTLTLYKSLDYLPASIAVILLMQFVWIGAFLEYLLFRRKPSRAELISICIVLAGTVLATGLIEESSFQFSLTGVLFGLLAATFYSVFLLVNSHVGNSYPSVQKSALMLTGACFIIFLIYPPVFLYNGVFIAGLWKWGMLLALVSAIIPPLFFAIAIPHVGVSLSSILSSVELPVAVVVAHLVLGEPVTFLQWFGVVLILSAVILSNVFRKKESHNPSNLKG